MHRGTLSPVAWWMSSRSGHGPFGTGLRRLIRAFVYGHVYIQARLFETSSSLTCQRRPAAAGSLATLEVLASRHFTKYLPVTPSTSGEDARYTDVSAPWAGLLKNGDGTRIPNVSRPCVSPSRP